MTFISGRLGNQSENRPLIDRALMPCGQKKRLQSPTTSALQKNLTAALPNYEATTTSECNIAEIDSYVKGENKKGKTIRLTIKSQALKAEKF